ncbi:MAG: PEPxxWA-CTERM sorting domain-containing protein [Sandarakinorhabdus sp.]|nr:PEPxxWA-CTERM sorting domain-containing protein [Sandarakinorhabdus sp.]
MLKFGFFNPPAFYNLDNVSVTAAVPEAATWTMLIAGFGLVGPAMRRRQAALAA